ncbi:MAG TPA: FxsA family protein [Casimicrobiaceae bacterium]|jgi:UPF0716 protein FxsA|nr:FxsA family protein [Casimicrobiaceae bacterium]
MRFLTLAIVMLFPLLDLVVTARFARWSGVPMWMWLTVSAIAGLYVLTHERAQFRTRTLAAFRGDQSLMRGLLDSGRRVLAGMLLVVPGILTDVVALVLLALPINQRGEFDPQPVTAGRVRRTLEGNYRRLD